MSIKNIPFMSRQNKIVSACLALMSKFPTMDFSAALKSQKVCFSRGHGGKHAHKTGHKHMAYVRKMRSRSRK